MGKEISLKDVSKTYVTNQVLAKINLDIKAGERIVLLGPSGSGKSTLLRMIAGLETITSGQLYLGDNLANDQDCGERNIAMVFQNYALYPHMTVAENITFALKANRLPKEVINNRLTEALAILGLTDLETRLPRELSGGQRQRTALARALVKKSDFFLLDEPLSNLDVRLRLDARKELVKIHEKYGQTFVYVTHDQIEAMTLADRIVVLNDGRIQMVASPQEVYARPANVFTATFIGSPGMNILPVLQQNDRLLIAGQKVELSTVWLDYLRPTKSGQLLFGVRPEHLLVTDQAADFRGKVKYCELLGQSFALTVLVNGIDIIVLHDRAIAVGQEIQLQVDRQKCHFFDKDSQENIGYPQD